MLQPCGPLTLSKMSKTKYLNLYLNPFSLNFLSKNSVTCSFCAWMHRSLRHRGFRRHTHSLCHAQYGTYLLVHDFLYFFHESADLCLVFTVILMLLVEVEDREWDATYFPGVRQAMRNRHPPLRWRRWPRENRCRSTWCWRDIRLFWISRRPFPPISAGSTGIETMTAWTF